MFLVYVLETVIWVFVNFCAFNSAIRTMGYRPEINNWWWWWFKLYYLLYSLWYKTLTCIINKLLDLLL